MLLVAVAGALALAYLGWLRDSSLVAVRDVKIAGALSADRNRIVAALTDAAQGMTTLHVQPDRLAEAVRGFPTVASVSAQASFPHGMTIEVTEREPALIASDGDDQLPVAANGAVLPGLDVGAEELPELSVDSLPASGKLSGEGLEEALVIGAAPASLRPLIAKASVSSEFGVVLTTDGGIELRFGSAQDAKAKWSAAAAVLADRGLASLSYINLRVPGRPAVG